MYQNEYALLEKQLGAIKAAFSEKRITSIYFVACGGSLATIAPGKYLVDRLACNVKTGLYTAGEFYADPPVDISSETLIILNSQSGNTQETCDAAGIAKEKGALLLAFTTNSDSRITALADYTVLYYDTILYPYPLALSIFPCVWRTIFTIIDVLEQKTYSKDVFHAMEHLEEICDAAYTEHKQEAKKFASMMRNEKNIYTIGAGIDHYISYILSNCLFMESLWLNSSAVHAGEFFHGAFEAFDNRTAVFVFLGLGNTRSLEQRAVIFLQRKTEKLTVLDAKRLSLDPVAFWLRPYVAPLVLNFLAAKYCDELSYAKGHPISSRRYMGIEKY